MKSSPFSGSTPAHFSCAHFENDVQRNRLSTLAEFRKLSWQKIHTASSSTFVFSLLFGSYSFTLSQIFSLRASILLYFLIFLVFLMWTFCFYFPLPLSLRPAFPLGLGLPLSVSFLSPKTNIFCKGYLLELKLSIFSFCGSLKVLSKR